MRVEYVGLAYVNIFKVGVQRIPRLRLNKKQYNQSKPLFHLGPIIYQILGIFNCYGKSGLLNVGIPSGTNWGPHTAWKLQNTKWHKVKENVDKFYSVRNLDIKSNYQNLPTNVLMGLINQQWYVAHYREKILRIVRREESFSGCKKRLCSLAVKGWSRNYLWNRHLHKKKKTWEL